MYIFLLPAFLSPSLGSERDQRTSQLGQVPEIVAWDGWNLLLYPDLAENGLQVDVSIATCPDQLTLRIFYVLTITITRLQIHSQIIYCFVMGIVYEIQIICFSFLYLWKMKNTKSCFFFSRGDVSSSFYGPHLKCCPWLHN